MIIFINGLQWAGYKKFEWGVVGESACADSWGRALKTGEPSLSIPCYAERRYGGVLDEEMLMAIPPHFLPKAIEGMKRLAANGLRYPIPQYGIQSDARAGLSGQLRIARQKISGLFSARHGDFRTPARAEEDQQVLEILRRQVSCVRGHVVAAVHNSNSQIVFGQAIADVTQVGSAMTSDTGDLVAELASLFVEQLRAVGNRTFAHADDLRG